MRRQCCRAILYKKTSLGKEPVVSVYLNCHNFTKSHHRPYTRLKLLFSSSSSGVIWPSIGHRWCGALPPQQSLLMNLQNMSPGTSGDAFPSSRQASGSIHSQSSSDLSRVSAISSVSSFPSLSGSTPMTSPSSMSSLSPPSTYSPALSSRSLERVTGTPPLSGHRRATVAPTGPMAFNSFSPTVDDRNNAMRLMQQERQGRGKTHDKPFTYKESNPVLAGIAQGKFNKTHGVTPGVVQVLLGEFEANLSVMKPKSNSILKMVVGVDQDDILHSTNLLIQAMEHCDAEIVSVLLRYADAQFKTQALPLAMRIDDPLKVQYAMASGADASPLCEEFQRVVESGSYETFCALVASSKTRGPCTDCLNNALIKVVRQKSLRRTLTLLKNGADITFKDATALFLAIENGNAELVDAISSFARHVDPKIAVEMLSRATVFAYGKIDNTKYVEAQYKIIQSCLAAGGTGPGVAEVLISALMNGQFSLVQSFAQCQVPVYRNHDAGKAVVDGAVATADPGIVRCVLGMSGGPAPEQMRNGMTLALALENHEAAIAIVGLFLERGFREDRAISQGLLSSVNRLVQCFNQPRDARQAHKAFLGLVNLLLSTGAADVNFQGGDAILQAAAHGLQDVVDLLLRHKPSIASTTKSVLPVMQLQDPSKRLSLMKTLLNAGAENPSVGEALTISAGVGKDHVGLTSLLLRHASVNFGGGRPLVSAVRSGCIDQIRLTIESGTLSPPAIAAAWTEVKSFRDEGFQMQVYESFFKHVGAVDVSLCDKALVGAASLGHRGRQLCMLMLQHGASPARLNGQAVAAASKSLDLSTIKLLSRYVSSSAVYTTAFAALTQSADWLTQEGLEIVDFLLGKGASGESLNSAFCQAARHHHRDAVQLLMIHVGSEVLGEAIKSAMENQTKWVASDYSALELLTELLEAGAASEHVNDAFVNIVGSGQATEEIVEIFMTVGEGHANANFQDGEALKLVIRQGNPRLLNRMFEWAEKMKCCASQGTMTQAFAETITTDSLDDEKVILETIDVLVRDRQGTPKPDFSALLPNYYNWAPMFACIKSHPNFPRLVTRLAGLGCNVQAETYLPLYDDEDVQAEPANLLTWALCLTEEHRIDSVTIEALINANVDINFTSAVSAATPLILAAKYGRGDIASKLINGKARVAARDCFDRSALFYSSRVGNLEAVQALVKAKSRVNDGSLHEAARNLHFEVVQLLLKAGHHTNYPSGCHNGRDALQELAFLAQPSRSEAPVLEDTLRALAGVKEKGEKCGILRDSGALGEKNALFLALDNPFDGCWLICRALLEVTMWKFVNEPTNVCALRDEQTGTQQFLSPTMYVRLGYFQGPQQQQDDLLQLLARMKCQDRLYAELGAEQPLNAVGLPDEIAKAETRRKAKEEKIREEKEDNRRKDQRKEHEDKARSLMDQIRHDEKLLHQREVEEQKRYQAELTHMQHQRHTNDSHQQKIHLQAEMAQSQQYWAMEKARFEETKRQRMDALAQDKLQREQQLKMEFDQRMTAQKLQRQKEQNALAQQQANRRLQNQRHMQALRAKGEKQKLEFKKKQDAQAKKMLTAQTAHKRIGHRLQMAKAHEDQQTIKMKAAMKYLDAKNAKKRIGA